MRPLSVSRDATPIRDTGEFEIDELRERDRRTLLSAETIAPPLASNLSERAAARRLVKALVARGADTFFGIPGGPVCPVFEAIRCTPGARLVESRHESHAAFAAATYARSSGRIPVVVVTAGPGVTNAVTGIASASLECAPMLVIAGDVSWAATGGCTAQDSGPEGISIESMLAPITRIQLRAAHARSVVSQGLAALDVASDPLFPGPALFVLPLDRGMAECEEVEITPRQLAFEVTAPSDAVSRCAAWLSSAQRPLVVIGGGCRGHEATIRSLVDALNVPFVTTPRAKGLVSERHPRSLRNGGMAASLWARRYTAQPVDVCLVLGTDLDDTSMGPTRYLGEGGKLVHVDLNPRVFGRNLPTALAITADVGSFADALCREVEGAPLAPLGVRAALAEAKASAPFDVAEYASDAHTPIRPHRVIADLQAAMPASTRFITDIGEHMLFALHYLTAAHCDSFCVQLNLGSMGSGIAGAIGLAIADRKTPVVCIAGDGGMQMAGMEALVAVRENLPILFVVFNDGRYNMVHHGMRQIFGAAEQYDAPFIDFAAWAASFGLPAISVSSPGEITRELIEHLQIEGGPALLDVRIDSSVRIRGGGRVEALQHMSMLSNAPPTREEA